MGGLEERSFLLQSATLSVIVGVCMNLSRVLSVAFYPILCLSAIGAEFSGDEDFDAAWRSEMWECGPTYPKTTTDRERWPSYLPKRPTKNIGSRAGALDSFGNPISKGTPIGMTVCYLPLTGGSTTIQWKRRRRDAASPCDSH